MVGETGVLGEDLLIERMLEITARFERLVMLNKVSTDVVWVDYTQACNADHNAMPRIYDESVLL